MKKILSLALALALILSLAACGGGKTASAAKSEAAKPAGGESTPTIGELNQALADATGGKRDADAYPFPAVKSQTEWPGADVWAALGLPDMTPAVMSNGEIYNDGATHVDGFTDAFTAICDTDEASYRALADMLWEKGFRGIDAGGGIIVDASAIEELQENNPNYFYYRAYYDLNGDLMQVELQKTTFNETIWVTVKYAPSDPEFRSYDKIDWPAARIKELTGGDLPNPGGTLRGSITPGEEDYWALTLYVEGVSESDYDAYINSIRSGGAKGIMEDPGYGSESFRMGEGEPNYMTYFLVPEDYEKYPVYINVSYALGVVSISIEEV